MPDDHITPTDRYYSERVARSDDLLWQVGKTVNGEPVDRKQLQLIVGQIVSLLDLTPEDRVLDIGAGNGLLTNLVAPRCAQVTGLERNRALFEQALKHAAGNVSYVCQSLLEADWRTFGAGKAYLYEVVQHLSYPEVATFLHALTEALPAGGRVLLGGIPSETEKWHFYADAGRRACYLRALAAGTDVMGTWYHPDFFRVLAQDLGLSCRIEPQPEALYTAFYRFDCLLSKP